MRLAAAVVLGLSLQGLRSGRGAGMEGQYLSGHASAWREGSRRYPLGGHTLAREAGWLQQPRTKTYTLVVRVLAQQGESRRDLTLHTLQAAGRGSRLCRYLSTSYTPGTQGSQSRLSQRV